MEKTNCSAAWIVDMSSETVRAAFRCNRWTYQPPTLPTASKKRLIKMLGAATRTVRRKLIMSFTLEPTAAQASLAVWRSL